MTRQLHYFCVLLVFWGVALSVTSTTAQNVPTQSAKSFPQAEVVPQQAETVSPTVVSQQASAQQPSTGLAPYGYNFFTRLETSKEVMGSLIFPPNYRLGPGDRLGIFLVGKIQQNFDVVVNVEGKIFLPNVGVISVLGLTMEECKLLLEKRLAQFYANFSLDLMLINPKQVQVAVVGDVRNPGKYVISALKTVLDAVIQAGGPTSKGSLRNIQLLRQDKLFAVVDLYQFLMKGKTRYDFFLEPGDRIFVPLVEATVSIQGEVRRPAVFELKSGARERLSDLIELAGGFTPYALLDKIEISRRQENGERKVFYINYHQIMENDSSEANIELRHDDAVRVYSKLEQLHTRYVSIYGEVRHPGKYVLEDSLRLSDLILKAGNLTRSAYLLSAEVAKVDPKKPAKFVRVNLQKLLNDHDPSQDILLEEDDQVFIRKIPEWEVGPTVEVRGEVMFPGVYPIVKDSTWLSEIMEKAGGFTKDALIREATLIRKSSRITMDKEYERLKTMSREEMSDIEYQYFVMKQNTTDIGRIVVDFYKLVVEKDRSEDLVLEDGDVIQVPKAPKVVWVTGRVARPGGILYVPGKKLKYYLNKAGGPTWDANVRKIKITKVTGEILDDEDVKNFVAGDIIWVPRKPERNWWTIFRETIAVVAQISTVYLIVNNALRK